MPLKSLARLALIFPSLPGTDAPTVLRELAERLAAQGLVPSADDLYRRLWDREQLSSTGIGSGVAIPHCKMAGLKRVLLAIGVANQGVDFGAVDGRPVKVFFLLISPKEEPAQHLQSLSAISKWVKVNGHVNAILDLADPQAIYELLGDDE